ncbi:MAG: AI-2E family transporter [Kineosporiaceae bacterium]
MSGPVTAPEATPARSAGLPGPVVVLVGLASAAIVLGAMRVAQDILGPAILALVIAIAVSPLQAWLAARVPSWLAIITTVVATFAALSAFVTAIGWSLFEFGTEIPRYQSEFNELVDNLSAAAEDFGVSDGQVDDVLGLVDFGAVAGVALDLAQGLYGALTALSFIVALLFFLLVDGGSFGRRFAAVRRFRPEVARSLSEFAGGVRRYLVVTTVFGLVVAAFDVVFLLIVGVPLAFVWGVLAFLTGYIPTIGLILGLVPPVVIALLEDGWPTALLVLVGYIVINNTIQNVVQPKFIGDAVGFNIATSFLSLVVWGFVLGPLGALLAIPMSLLARAVLSDRDPRHRWLGVLLSDRPPADDEVHRLAVATGAEAPPSSEVPSAAPAAGPPAEPPDVPEPRSDPAG